MQHKSALKPPLDEILALCGATAAAAQGNNNTFHGKHHAPAYIFNSFQ